MRMTRHNGRAGKNGAYNPKHNDRRFDLENSEHIDAERSKQNLYWDIFNGYRTFNHMEPKTELADTFEDVEQLYYEIYYRDYVKGQNARNEKTRHTERNRTAEQIRKNKKTCPEETVYQIGTMDDHVTPEVLMTVVSEFMDTLEKRFGSNVHILDWALHLDESTPHIHERHVFDCKNKYGELCPQQEKALEELGFELPEPDQKQSRHNNRKMVFDSACRALLFEIAKKNGLELEEEPEYGGRKYLEKQDYILMKQKERIADRDRTIAQQGEKISGQVQTLLTQHSEIGRNADEIQSQQETINDQRETIQSQQTVMEENEESIGKQGEILDDLVMRTEDVEALLQEVSEEAYDKAVEVVTDAVRVETQENDLRVIKEIHDWLLKPERTDPEPKRLYAVSMLDRVADRLRNSAQKAFDNVKESLQSKDKRSEGVEQIKAKAKKSVLAKLNRNKESIAKRDQERKKLQQGRPQQNRKKNMEL